MLLAAAISGCAKGETPAAGTWGELGQVAFNYQQSCLFGCSLEQPLLVGTRERIEVTAPGDADGVSVESSAPDVALFALERSCHCERSDTNDRLAIREDAECPGVWRKHCDNHVLVQAAGSGEATLELRDRRHDLIDRATVLVREARDARFAATLPDVLGERIGSQFELAVGSSLGLELTLFDEDGLMLLAPEGVDWHVTDSELATISGFLTGNSADVHGGLSVNVHAVAEGETTVQIDVPGLDASIELRVTP